MSNSQIDSKNQDLVKGLGVLVVYVSILFLTVLILTYIAYKVASFSAYNFSPQTIVLCGVFACILGLLAPEVVAHASSITLWLTALLSLLILSSFVLSKTTDVIAGGTTETNSMTSLQEGVPQDIPVNAEYFVNSPASDMTDTGVDNALATPAPSVEMPAEEVLPRTQEIEESKQVPASESLEAIDVDEAMTIVEPEEPILVAEGMPIEPGPAAVDCSENITLAEVELCMPEPTKNDLFSNEHDDRDFAYYLELGFNAKEVHDYSAATRAFQKAIDVEPENTAVLYIITEICALLQLQGYYEEAIQQMQKGRDLAIALQDHSMANEFVDGIAYIRILKNVLLSMRIPFTPYSALAEDVKSAIDAEFRQWKNQ